MTDFKCLPSNEYHQLKAFLSLSHQTLYSGFNLSKREAFGKLCPCLITAKYEIPHFFTAADICSEKMLVNILSQLERFNSDRFYSQLCTFASIEGQKNDLNFEQ